MRVRTKLLIKIWISRLIICFFVGTLIWLNINRLQDNLYANYEKTVDYGRVREVKESVDPVMAAIFYEKEDFIKKNIINYLNHSDNYKKKNVRMIVVAKTLNQNNEDIIRKLYSEIKKYNIFKKISLVYSDNDDFKQHLRLLQEIADNSVITLRYLSADAVEAESDIKQDLQDNDTLVVFLADLSKGLKTEGDFLLEEATYFAQKNSYHMKVFDIIDTQLARAIDKDYRTLFSLSSKHNLSRLSRQKNNLKQYAKNYKDELFKYFLLNLYDESKEKKWPKKTPKTYRLFDRGDVYIKLLDHNRDEIFGYGRVERNESVVVTMIDISKKVLRRTDLRKIKYIELYLLTELEKVNYTGEAELDIFLDADDGVVARYENFYTIMLPDDRPKSNLIDVLRKRAGVPVNADNSDIKFFKFKSVRVEYEN